MLLRALLLTLSLAAATGDVVGQNGGPVAATNEDDDLNIDSSAFAVDKVSLADLSLHDSLL